MCRHPHLKARKIVIIIIIIITVILIIIIIIIRERPTGAGAEFDLEARGGGQPDGVQREVREEAAGARPGRQHITDTALVKSRSLIQPWSRIDH